MKPDWNRNGKIIFLLFLLNILMISGFNCRKEIVNAPEPQEIDPIVFYIGSVGVKLSEFTLEFQNLAGGVIDSENIQDEEYEMLVDQCLKNITTNYFLDQEAIKRKISIDDEDLTTKMMIFTRNFRDQDF